MNCSPSSSSTCGTPSTTNQLPTQPVARRGRGRRLRDLSQDRVPRAPQSLRRPRVNAPIAGFDTDRETFFGLRGKWEAPEVVLAGQSRNSIASGWAPIGSHQLDIELAPGSNGPGVRTRLRGERRGRQVGVARRRQQGARPRVARTVLDQRAGRCRARAAAYWRPAGDRHHQPATSGSTAW